MTNDTYQPASRSDMLLARQPIFDGNGALHAYELLHRPDGVGGFDVSVGDDRTSSEVIVNAFPSVGIGRIIGGAMAHVKF